MTHIIKTQKTIERLLTAAAIGALILTANVFAQNDTAWVTVHVNSAAGETASITLTPPSGGDGTTVEVPIGVDKTFMVLLGSNTVSVSRRAGRADAAAGAAFRRAGRGNVSLALSQSHYQNAAVSLHTLNGKRVMHGKLSAQAGAAAISRPNLAPGIYILSVKGVMGSAFTQRLSHIGGKLNIGVAFTGGISPDRLAKAAAASNEWTLLATTPAYSGVTATASAVIEKGNNPTIYIKFAPDQFCWRNCPPAVGSAEVPPTRLPPVDAVAPRSLPNPPAHFTETVGDQTFDMVYMPGGAITNFGGSSSTSATVSPYYISKGEVSSALWNAVMGSSGGSTYGGPQFTWYDAMIFVCRLSKLTGRNYRMQTEAEFEFAARNRDILSGNDTLRNMGPDNNGSYSEEWAYNSWSGTPQGGDDPVGPGSGVHTQKTRRDAGGTTGRLIRSIEGIGPQLRLTISATADFPPGYVPPCDLHAPEMEREPYNSYRDMRWVTGSDSAWTAEEGGYGGNFDLMLWEDGSASMRGYSSGRTQGRWFTSNNIVLVFVPNSSSSTVSRYPYVLIDATHASLLGGGGRIHKTAAASSVTKPDLPVMSGEELARARPDFETHYKMVDMERINETHKNIRDARLFDTTSTDPTGENTGWFQNNSGAGIGGTHNYRKDVDDEEFRFTVNQFNGNRDTVGMQTMLANGPWFTVNNTFLRITHPTGYQVDYVYTISNNSFGHCSFMGYERGDSRSFSKVNNATYNWPGTCISSAKSSVNICSDEIPKNGSVSMYANGATFPMRVGQTTFVPAPCPPGGCN